MTGKPTFDEFRIALMYRQRRDELGMTLTDDQARQLMEDEGRARAFYDTWQPAPPVKPPPQRAVRPGFAGVTEPDAPLPIRILRAVGQGAVAAVVLLVSAVIIAGAIVGMNAPKPEIAAAPATPSAEAPVAAAPVAPPPPAPEPVVAPPPPPPEPAAPVAPPAPNWQRCADVKAAGAAPIYRGDPGWKEQFDGNDNDGIGCEG